MKLLHCLVQVWGKVGLSQPGASLTGLIGDVLSGIRLILHVSGCANKRRRLSNNSRVHTRHYYMMMANQCWRKLGLLDQSRPR